MATTTIQDIYYPTTATQISPLATQFSTLAASVEAALNLGSNRFIGTDAQRIALAGVKLREGITFYATDTDREWIYSGTSWLSNVGGMYLITPTSVAGTGVTINANGTVNVGSTGSSVTINGVFTTRFKRYRVLAEWAGAAVNGAQINFTAAGTANVATQYSWQSLYAVISGAPAATFNPSLTYFPGALAAANDHYCQIDIVNPADATRLTKYVSEIMDINSSSAYGHVGGMHGSVTAFDGFRIALTASTFISGEIAVYGLA